VPKEGQKRKQKKTKKKRKKKKKKKKAVWLDLIYVKEKMWDTKREKMIGQKLTRRRRTLEH